MTHLPGRLGRWLHELTVADWVGLVYLLLLNLLLWGVEPSPARTHEFVVMGALLAAYVAVLAAVRGRLTRHSPWISLLYRCSHLGVMLLSYFAYTDYLPVVNRTTLDLELHAFDLWLFGVEPAVAFDAIVTPALTEWFSFFYYGYFFIVLFHSVFVVLCVRDVRRLTEFVTGMVLLYGTGQVLYLVVPGYGPYHALPHLFTQELPHGFWWGLVQDIVRQGGAQMDIFPSMHTAAPMYVFLFSFANRRVNPFRVTWPFMGFAAANIMIATMYLRWHYVIDVIVGASVCLAAFAIARRVAVWEPDYRRRLQLTPTWPVLGRDAEVEPPSAIRSDNGFRASAFDADAGR